MPHHSITRLEGLSPVQQAMNAQRENRGTALLGARWGVGQRQAPTALSRKYPSTHCHGAGPHDRSGRVRKISPPPPGYDPRTVKPVTSRSTDYAIPAQGRIEERRKQGTENFVQ